MFLMPPVFLPLGSSHSMFGAEGVCPEKGRHPIRNALKEREDWFK
jgi:hypothetical protein